MKRIAIVSDTHAYLSPDVVAVIETCDVVVHAGDIGSAEVLESLYASATEVIAVCGNNDIEQLWASHEAHVVNSLPRVGELRLPGGILAVEHGHAHGFHAPDHAKLRQAHPRARVVVYGHTHKRVIDQSQAPWVVNPGAAGHVRNHGGPSCLVLHAGEQSWDIETFQFPDQGFAAESKNPSSKAGAFGL